MATARSSFTGRTRHKARDARHRLTERTGQDVFESLELDLDESESIHAAADALIERGPPRRLAL